MILEALDHLCSSMFGVIFVSTLLLGILVSQFISRRYRNRPRGVNPFSKDHRRPCEPLVTDVKERDKVLKQGFSLKKVRSRWVVSDAGLYNTFEKLLPREVSERCSLYQRLSSSNLHGHAALSLFVGLKGSSQDLGLGPSNMWAFTSPHLDQVCGDFLSKSADEVADTDIPLLFISFPSTKDPTWDRRYPGRSVCTIITLARWEWFEAWEGERVMKRGEEYSQRKMGLARRMWHQCTTLYPQLATAEVEYMDIGTPLSNNYYLGSTRGEIYGLDHGVNRFSPQMIAEMRPDTDVPNLFLTGQDTFICGFAGALFGGLLCASKMLNRNMYAELEEARKGWKC